MKIQAMSSRFAIFWEGNLTEILLLLNYGYAFNDYGSVLLLSSQIKTLITLVKCTFLMIK